MKFTRFLIFFFINVNIKIIVQISNNCYKIILHILLINGSDILDKKIGKRALISMNRVDLISIAKTILY